MEAHIKLGRIFGIQIGLHLSWFLIGLLVTLSLAAHFSAVNPEWGSRTVWITAIVTGLLFFLAVILHELAHAVVARYRGLPVRSITLFALGGVASIEKEAADPSTEFWMGIAGPIASVLIGAACLVVAGALGWSSEAEMMTASTPALAALVWLGYINITLAIFNMIPGFPLDGGRVLRAVIWWITDSVDRSTRIAARVGQATAIFFIVLGVFQFFSGLGLGGLWIAFIGWFLLNAAGASLAQSEVLRSLRGLTARDVMSRECETASAGQTLDEFVNENLLRTGRRCYIVVDSGRLVGIITPHQIRDIPRHEWHDKTVADVMRPLDELHTITPPTSLEEALEKMTRDDVNQLPVVDRGGFAGIVSRDTILQVLRTRRELHV